MTTENREPETHTLIVAEMAPLVGSRTVVREELAVAHKLVDSVTIHVKLRKPLSEGDDLGVQLRIDSVGNLEAPKPALGDGGPSAVPPKAAEAVDCAVERLGYVSEWTGSVIATAGTHQGVVHGMRALLSKGGVEHAYARGSVVFVDDHSCQIGYAKLVPAEVEVADKVYLRRRSDGEAPVS